MVRRIVIQVAILIAAVLLGGYWAWAYHVHAVAAQIDAQAQTAQALVDSAPSTATPEHLVDVLARPDIEVIVHPNLFRKMPGPHDFHYAIGAPPPPMPMPPFGHRDRNHWFAYLIADLAHIPPRHVGGADWIALLAPSPQALARWFLTDALICGIAIVVLGTGAWITAKQAADAARQPLLRTTAALEGLAAGDFEPQRVEAGDSPEIARLARAYNAAAETVARSIEERQAAAAEFQRFLADAGHELRTPLTILSGYIDVLHGGAAEDEARERIFPRMKTAAARMRVLVEKMLLLSRLESPAGSPAVIDVANVVSEVLDAMRAQFPGREIAVRCHPACRVFIDEGDLFEALRNVVENALRYAPGSRVDVACAIEGEMVSIAVSDRGPGIPADERTMVFERFYRGREHIDREGTGLGLAIVRRIVERWHGTVSLESSEAGTTVEMRFPQARADA